MHYEGDIYRPPSEARSLIVQVTVGCTHNGCTFCPSYKAKNFRLKPFETVLEDLIEARKYYRRVERVFFADGDAFCMTTGKLMRLLDAVREIFPECRRVGSYARAEQILKKSEDELKALLDAGLGILYIGAESGSDEVLRRVNKGETSARITEAVRKAERAGIQTSVTFISGLGGKELMEEHAVKTGEMISAMGASYIGLLTLLLTPETPLFADVLSGDFTQLSPLEAVDELEIIISNVNCGGVGSGNAVRDTTGNVNCGDAGGADAVRVKETVLRSNHPSNWLELRGTLPRDKDAMLEQIRGAKSDPRMLRSGRYRAL